MKLFNHLLLSSSIPHGQVKIDLNLLLMLVCSKVKRQWAFSNMTSLLRGQLMSYINLYSFLNDPEKTWREKNEAYKREMQLSIFPT